MIEAGQKFPSLTIKHATAEGPADLDLGAAWAGKKVAIFALPGAFTPTCSAKHLPGFVEKLPELTAQGVDIVACLSVNDAFVMKAWAEAHDALGKITMLADGDAKLTDALGIAFDIPGLGHRAKRGLIMVEDNVVTSIDMEAPGKLEVSSAEACLLKTK